ncbi:DUF1266 domain-containing protein [Oceanispirochaeta sp. M1]|uniref:DUF1266 domain-containing protein n=1 Tax=Oceanispirochaeta sp. M1 TaxID=2283433 RepID=UPI0014952E2B
MDYPVQIILDLDSDDWGSDLLEVRTDQRGKVQIPLLPEYTSDTAICIPSLDQNPGKNFCMSIDYARPSGVELILAGSIQHSIRESLVSWLAISDAEYYKVEAYDLDEEFYKQENGGLFLFSNTRQHESYEIQRLKSLGNGVNEDSRVFTFQGTDTEFILPPNIIQNQRLAILISAYNKNDILLAQSPGFSPQQNNALGEDSIRFEFKIYGRDNSDVNFDIVSKNEDGEFEILEQFNTGTNPYLQIEKKSEWPQDVWINLYAHGYRSDGSRIRRNIKLNKLWGKTIRLNMQVNFTISLNEEGITWSKVHFADHYTVSVYRYKEAKRTRYIPLLVEYDVVDDRNEPFSTLTLANFRNLVELDSVVYEETLEDITEWSWPSELPRLNHYAVVVKSYSDDGMLTGLSLMKPWPLKTPTLSWDSNNYNKEAAAVSLNGIMMELHKTNSDTLPIYPLAHSKYESLRDRALGQDWGIHNEADLLNNLEGLKDGGTSSSMQNILSILKDESEGPLWKKALDEDFSLKQMRRLQSVLYHREFYDDRLLHAWDWGRATYLIRWGYSLGYISEDEAWKQLFQFQKMIQDEYKSWIDFGQSYVLGRYFWSLSYNTAAEKAQDAWDAFLVQFEKENSPWTGPWIDNDPQINVELWDLDSLLSLESEEEIFEWALDAEKKLNSYPDELESLLSNAPSGWDKHPQIVQMILESYERNQDHKGLIEFVSPYLESFPEYYPFYQILARVQEESSGIEEALHDLNQMDALSRESPENCYLKGRLLYLLKEPEEAIKFLRIAGAEENSDNWYHNNALYITGLIYVDNEDWGTACNLFADLNKRLPENPIYQYYYAVSLLLGSDPDYILIRNLLTDAEESGEVNVPSWIWARVETEYLENEIRVF